MIQSIASRSLPANEILYQRKKVTVTPSWLEVKNTSYAIRFIQQLTLQNLAPPRIEAGLIFIVSLVLTIWQAIRIMDDKGPEALNWVLMAICLVLLLVSSFIAFAMKARYRLDIRFVKGPALLSIERPTRADLLELHEALSLAMNWHRGEAETGEHIQESAGETA